MEGGENMNPLKRIFATILMLCMVFTLTACGGNGNGDTEKNTEGSQNESTVDKNTEDAKDTQVDDGKIVYKVTLVDEEGNPVEGALVQMCLNSCVPARTADNGVAEFNLVEEEGYKVEITMLPAGYEKLSEEPVYLENGQTELTITVKKVQ